MVDIFNEISDELRRDKMARLWDRHAGKIISLLLALVICSGSWSYWQYHKTQKTQDAAVRLNEVSKHIRDGKNQEAEKVLEDLANTTSGGYQPLARLRLAAEVGKRDIAAGVKAFQALATDQALSSELRELSALRAVMLNVDNVSFEEVRAAIGALNAPTNPWRNSAREMLGLSALKAGQFEEAGRYFDLVMIDPQATPSMRSRMEVYAELVRSSIVIKPSKSGS